jgi:hypothetical protein
MVMFHLARRGSCRISSRARLGRTGLIHERITDLDGLAHRGPAHQLVGPSACVHRAIDLRREAGDCRTLR